MSKAAINNEPVLIFVDLFGGGGGDANGIEDAELEGEKIAKVIVCINHDDTALQTHKHNFPDVRHYKEDIRTVNLSELKSYVELMQRKYPNAKLVLWGSFPCPHFSKALGNKPKDEGIRTMAKSLYMNFIKGRHVKGDSYVQVLKPDYIIIENVEEFMSWGPLNDKGKPITKQNGQEWLRWRDKVCSFGYVDQWKEINSADHGAFTSRNRLFGIFAKKGLPIAWPTPTHAKNPTKGDLFKSLDKWKPVKELLNLNDVGTSILNRKKPLADKTIIGITKGIKKFASAKEDYFLFHYYGAPFTTSINSPCPSFRTKQSAYLIQAFIYNSSHGGNCSSINQPCPVIVARQDKAPLRLVTCVKSDAVITINDNDTEAYKLLKKLMIENGIYDILYRPLRISEKKVIQGFPSTYHFCGNQAQQDKQIGNSVVPLVAQVITQAIAEKLIEYKKTKAA